MSETAAAPAAPAAPKKAGKSSVLMIAVVALVVASGAGAGAFWYARKGAPVVEKKEKASDRGVVTFEPFVVNLADPNASRFLRISIQLVVKNAEEAEGIQKKPALVMSARSAILEILANQTSDTVVTQAGKTQLKKVISERASAVLDETKVMDVLFSDFVVQF
jgi:flagellar FliL protein